MNVQSDKVKAIFLEALDKPTPAEQCAFLDIACGADATLRHRVDALLRAHQPDDSFLDPGKLHPQHTPSGHTQTSDFSDTSTVKKSDQPKASLLPELAQYFEPPQQPDSLGRFLHYEVLELLGQGGCGIVYRVFDTKLHRMVALKIMSPALASHPASRLRFLREARTAAAVRHEHVISIHAVDETPLPHLIMEYVSGQSLQQKIDKTGSLTTKEILRIGYQIALGLEAAHKQGLIHRDIKPANILLENGIERVKITDFGLARAIDDTNISHQGLIVGTPSYMSPEQAEGQSVDARSDLFSLGSTMYAMCAGQSPFQGSSTLTVLKRVVQDKPRSLKEANPELPDWLDAVIMKLLAKKPEARYQDASAVSGELAKYLADLQGKGTVRIEKFADSRFKVYVSFILLIFFIIMTMVLTEQGVFKSIYGYFFYHQLTLEMPDHTIVSATETSENQQDLQEQNARMITLTPYRFSPAAVTLEKPATNKYSFPPGKYWLVARRHGKEIDRRLLTIGWGGSSTVTITIPTDLQPSSGLRLLKAFDPAKDSPRQAGNIPGARYDSVKTEDGGYRLEFSKDAQAFAFYFSHDLKQIPAQGAVLCKAKVKFKKHDENSQLALAFHEGDGHHVKYEWPTQHLDLKNDSSHWTDIVLRYPAIALKSSSPQLTVSFHLMDHSIVHVKDLAFHFEPPRPPVTTNRTAELVKSVEEARKQWEAVEARFNTIQKGNGSIEHGKAERPARQYWIQQAIALAEDQQDRDALIFHLMRLKELQTAFVMARHTGSDLAEDEPNITVLHNDLAKTESRLMELLDPSVIGSERLLKRFDPKIENPVPAPWADPNKTVFVEDSAWRVENHLEAGMFYFAFKPLLENLPTDGIIICRAKIKLKKKSTNGWGEMLLNAEKPVMVGFDWPALQYQFQSDLDQWTIREIRYPASFFFRRNPPQICVYFSFHMTGTIWIKDLELLHLPGPVPASTSRVPELANLVELADQQMKTVNEQYQAGLVPYDAWLKAKANWLNRCINLSQERQLHQEVIQQIVQLQDTQAKHLQFLNQLIKAGRLKESDALPIKEEIVKTDLRLKQAKEKQPRK